MSPTFLLLYTITNEKTLKLTQIDRLQAASKIFPAETRSNNSGRYTCCYVLYTLVMPSPGVRVTVAESLIRDLGRVSEWCDLWGMKLNVSKTNTIIVSRSCTMHPKSPP